MKSSSYLFVFLLLFSFTFGQTPRWIYATVDEQKAIEAQNSHPDKIQILSISNSKAAVYVEETFTNAFKSGNLHGPGFIYRKDKESALNSLQVIYPKNNNVLNFTITEDSFVNECIDLVDPVRIGETIVMLENYGTRYHTTASGVQASLDLKDYWQDIVTSSGRTDVTVEYYNHNISDQKSVILTIPGSQSPDEIVIIGGHLDCGDLWIINHAPGADDNASGIGVLTEALRILLDKNFQPLKTVQIMAYAAEEAGLLGSEEIAEEYKNQNKNVLAVLQFDMTNYKGSPNDIYLISDAQYVSAELNLFLIELMEHYNSTGQHAITYGNTNCGYGCSDHVSWSERGYLAAFPFESRMSDLNPFYHSEGDTYANMNYSADHSAKFAKLALQFVIEVAKNEQMSTQDFSSQKEINLVVKDKKLIYNIAHHKGEVQEMVIYNANAQKVFSQSKLQSQGEISIQGLNSGFYIVVFKTHQGESFSKKFLVK